MHQFSEAERVLCGLLPTDHGANAVEHPSGSAIVFSDIMDDFAKFSDVFFRITLQQLFGCFKIVEDGAERLTEFVSECSGVLTERGESGGVLQLFLLPR